MHYVARGIHGIANALCCPRHSREIHGLTRFLIRFFYEDSHSEGTNQIAVFVTSMI